MSEVRNHGIKVQASLYVFSKAGRKEASALRSHAKNSTLVLMPVIRIPVDGSVMSISEIKVHLRDLRYLNRCQVLQGPGTRYGLLDFYH